MKIHEYQGKELLQKFKVPVPAGDVAETPDEARHVAKTLEKGPFVVKAQIHAGGRGKGGGIKPAATPEEVEAAAGQIIDMTLVTPQTGPEGRLVQKVLVEQAQDIVKEYYLGIVIDRSLGCPVIMMSSAGGMEIEEVAARTPELIIKEAVDPAVGLLPFQTRNLAFGVGLPPEHLRAGLRLYHQPLQPVCQPGLLPGGDQPPGAHRRGASVGPGRQDQPGRQRPVPAP
jgi:succinyl-CoA synthetase beta subunit